MLPANLESFSTGQLLALYSGAAPAEVVILDSSLRKRFLRPPALVAGAQGDVIVDSTGQVVGSQFSRDEWLNLLREGRCFASGGNGSAAVAAQFGATQIWNPVGSGVVVLVRVGRAWLAAAGTYTEVAHQMDTVQLALGTAQGNGGNLRSDLNGGGAADGKAVLRSNSAGGTSGSRTNYESLTGSGGMQSLWIAELRPGKGLSLWTLTVNTLHSFQLLWAEVPPSYL